VRQSRGVLWANLKQKLSYPNKIALIGNYLPRQCGIATFTTDLRASLAAENPTGDCWVIAMNDVPEGYRYPGQVRFEINQRILSDYRLAADFLNSVHPETPTC